MPLALLKAGSSQRTRHSRGGEWEVVKRVSGS